jgi:hypothetical protein
MNTTTHRLSSNALLWCSAFILLGLLVVQSGRIAAHRSNAARADLVSRVGEFTTLTLNAQSSEDVLVVLDGRGEQIFTYRILNQKQVELLKRYDLSTLFATGQRIGAGRVR